MVLHLLSARHYAPSPHLFLAMAYIAASWTLALVTHQNLYDVAHVVSVLASFQLVCLGVDMLDGFITQRGR